MNAPAISCPPRPLAIINADDFGLSDEVNRAILAAFEQGVISSTTIMANMPAFARACALARRHGLQAHIGLHFNLTYGGPLSGAIRNRREFCNTDGQFELRLARHRLHLCAAAVQALHSELQAQWTRCVQHGIVPSHIDSHQHIHNLWPIAAIVADFARAQQVPVRPARNLGRNIGPVKRLYKTLLNQRLRRSGVHTVRWVATPRDLLDGIPPDDAIEIIAHPILLADGSFGDRHLPANVSLQTVLRTALNKHQTVGYRAYGRAVGQKSGT